MALRYDRDDAEVAGLDKSLRSIANCVSHKQVSERVLSTASGVFHCSQEAVKDAATLQDLSGWDSIAHLNFILALEQEFGCSFTEEEMELFTSIRSVIEVIDAKQPS